MTMLRRHLLGSILALPALRRVGAQPVARVALLHVNDFHSRHEGAQENGAGCRPDRPCLGGSPRLVGAVKAARAAAQAEARGVLALDAGDQFMGSLYYTRHRGLAEAAIQQEWGCEAMAFGNHEFDHGPANVGRYVRALGVPMLAANLDTADEPELHGLVRPWMVFERGGARLAVIGLVTEDTPGIASPGPRLKFRDGEEATARAIAEIRATGPATIIVLSHRGYPQDRRMAADVAGIDAIIGGHSHTILANRPGAEGSHPVLVDGPDRAVRIVQAGALGRFTGRLDLDIAADGKVAQHGGDARELTPDLPEDENAKAIVARFGAALGELRARPVAQAQSAFDVASCRSGECAIGSLIAEAMLAAMPSADIALQNGGGIRAGLPSGTVSYGDVLTVLPFSNTVAAATIRGGHLLEALENGLSRPGEGRFPQIAGLRLAVDLNRPVGSRIVSATVLRGERAGPLDPERAYRIVTNDFLRRGGDGYTPLRDHVLDAYDTGPLLEEVVAAHLAAQSPLIPRTDGRIEAR